MEIGLKEVWLFKEGDDREVISLPRVLEGWGRTQPQRVEKKNRETGFGNAGESRGGLVPPNRA
ncbi:hypothetical protein Scep_007348 [Stephania cephalantha]|uniref:Uncharacterized protein n=1 Tax=Stephania cephalantha TaxID=152367 RepID=A0AAP0K9T5_9MAGN